MDGSRQLKPTRLRDDEEPLHSSAALKNERVDPQNMGLKTRVESVPMHNLRSDNMGEDGIWVQKDLWHDTETT